jgi:hypothetical protein
MGKYIAIRTLWYLNPALNSLQIELYYIFSNVSMPPLTRIYVILTSLYVYRQHWFSKYGADHPVIFTLSLDKQPPRWFRNSLFQSLEQSSSTCFSMPCQLCTTSWPCHSGIWQVPKLTVCSSEIRKKWWWILPSLIIQKLKSTQEDPNLTDRWRSEFGATFRFKSVFGVGLLAFT